MRALNGFALLLGSEVIGYSYYVCEDSKGLIGDIYVRSSYRCRAYEDQLLEAVVAAMSGTPNVHRIEAQLMLLAGSIERRPPFSEHLQRFQRDFMVFVSDKTRALPPAPPRSGLRFEPWTHKMQEEAAHLIAEAYSGHVDARINDQYRSVAGARRFLLNIVHYPGCGAFFGPASFVAVDDASGQLWGLCLASLVADDIGHITQICVSPSARRCGLGYEILRTSLQGLQFHGCREVSLTVTARNVEAIRLYERMGFRRERSFAAYVWEGFD
jgi:ribosomal protein S18 acetylase RimI-like enzyme